MGIGKTKTNAAASARRGPSTYWPSHALLLLGVVSLLAFVVAVPGGAVATAPAKFKVFLDADDSGTTYAETEFTQLVDVPYTVKFKGKSSATWLVTGIPVKDIVTKGASPEQALANFFGIWNNTDDRTIRTPVDSAYMNNDPPAIIVTGATSNGSTVAYKTPFLLTPQLASGENNGDPLIGNRSKLDSSLVNLQLGQGQLLHPTIKARRDSKSGTWTFVAGGASAYGEPYNWVLSYVDEKGKTVSERLPETKIVTTDKLTDSTIPYTVTLSITRTDGSYGMTSIKRTGSKKDDQVTTPPAGPTKETGGNTGNGNGGGGSTGSTGGGQTTTTTTKPYKPPPYVPPATDNSTVPPPVSSDTSGLAQAVSGLEGTGTYRAVSGVVLDVPPPAAAPAGGSPAAAGIERLAAPLGSVADDVFQPIDEPDQLWFGMLAVLLAAGVIGAMREYEKP